MSVLYSLYLNLRYFAFECVLKSVLCIYRTRWTKAHELLVQQEIKKDMLAVAVRESEAMLRSENFVSLKPENLLNSFKCGYIYGSF